MEARGSGPDRDRVHAIIIDWARVADTLALDHTDTSLGGDFLERIIRHALGYKSVTESPQAYQRQKQFNVPGAGTADGALGAFTDADHRTPVAVNEPEVGDVDLDHDNSAGCTTVQQCWDYLNGLPDCTWGIVSNFRVIRLCLRDRTPQAHEDFFIVEQLPSLLPDVYGEKCPRDRKQALERWISARVLRLTCTSNEMLPLVKAADFKRGIVKWKDAERDQIHAELDAAYLRPYGISDDAAE